MTMATIGRKVDGGGTRFCGYLGDNSSYDVKYGILVADEAHFDLLSVLSLMSIYEEYGV